MIANYEPNIERILALYQQLEDDVLKAMIHRMMRLGKVTESTAHQAEMLQLGGLLYEDILALIAQNTDASIEQVKALFEDAGVQTTEIDNRIHEDAGEMPIDIRQDDSVKQVLEAGYRKTWNTMQNLTSTTATNTQTAFLQACDRAYMQVSSGAFSYQEAIRMAIRNIADQGAYVTYPTGHKDRIDVAIRRCILTGVGQTAAAVAKQQAEDAECEYMELTAHSGARPDHAKWQGQLVIIRGKRTQKMIDGLRVYTLSEIGYGDGAGFKGWNCRHNWHPYYVGYSTPNYTQEELAELDKKHIEWNGEKYTDYEISQMQRSGERKVRALKRRCVATQEAIKNAPDEATKAALEGDYQAVATKLKASEQQLKEFCSKTEQDRDKFREQVHGFDRSQSQKAVWAAKKAKSGLTDGGNGGTIKESNPLRIDMQFFGKPNFSSQRTAGLKKTIRSLESRVEEHKRKIAEPEKIYEKWKQFSELEQAGFKKHWEKEIKNFEKQIKEAQSELEKRGESHE